MHFALFCIHCLVRIFALYKLLPTAITSLFIATKSQFLLYLIEIPPCIFTHTQQKVTGIVLPASQQNHACLAHSQLSKLSFHSVLRLLRLYLLFLMSDANLVQGRLELGIHCSNCTGDGSARNQLSKHRTVKII